MTTPTARYQALLALLLASLTVAHNVQAQAGAIRRAREAVRERALDLDAIFGKEPPITTSIDATAKRRLVAAVAARDVEWQNRQANALLYSKRAAGLAFAVRLTIQGLQDALYRYGAYLALLPETPAPWN